MNDNDNGTRQEPTVGEQIAEITRMYRERLKLFVERKELLQANIQIANDLLDAGCLSPQQISEIDSSIQEESENIRRQEEELLQDVKEVLHELGGDIPSDSVHLLDHIHESYILSNEYSCPYDECIFYEREDILAEYMPALSTIDSNCNDSYITEHMKPANSNQRLEVC